MVLNDITLQNMSYHHMTRVLRPKVEGSRILDQIFHDDPLDFFVLFSSLSWVFGRNGQSNYATANAYMAGLAAHRRARGVSASVIDIGAIMGTGYMAREVSDNILAQLVGSGYRKMSERDFHTTFANAILAGRVNSGDPEEIITGIYIPAPGEGTNFKPPWSHNVRFGHVLQRSGQAAVTSQATSSQKESTQDLLKQSKTLNDISRVLQGKARSTNING
jgi:hybrid polyketide synthase / nonribosomal peptide synthetase ACE1